jgi:hypothetical protein
MPPKTPDPTQDGWGIVHLHISNVDAFVTEDMMPTENQLKARVDFIYGHENLDTTAAKFWPGVGRKMNGRVESFIGKYWNLEPFVTATVGPNDSPEVKLQKLYARVQQMRNTSYEVEKTEEEQSRAKEKEPSNAEDAWKKGYASGMELTWLYLALVQGAGFEAHGVIVPSRADFFFDPTVFDDRQLNEGIVLVKLNGKSIFCDPGTLYTPFGLLPWEETGVKALQFDRKNPIWIQSLEPTSDQAETLRHASLTLAETGDLEGNLTVTYTGMEAAKMRVEERHADAKERKDFLEDAVKNYVPSASEVTLSNQPDWKSSELPLIAEFNFKVPGWAAKAGNHLLIPVGLFGAPEKHLFDQAERINPIYDRFPTAQLDDIDIQLPAGWKLSALPKGSPTTGKDVTYSLTVEDHNGNLHLSRSLAFNFILLDAKKYPELRNSIQQIKASDDEQVVVESGGARVSN